MKPIIIFLLLLNITLRGEDNHEGFKLTLKEQLSQEISNHEILESYLSATELELGYNPDDKLLNINHIELKDSKV